MLVEQDLISPLPLELSPKEKNQLELTGTLLVSFFNLVAALYHTDPYVGKVLSGNKPPDLLRQSKINKPNYIFLRPDMILTEDGFRICEIETSVFGLGMSYFLTFTYEQLGFKPINSSKKLGERNFKLLNSIITPTWVVQEFIEGRRLTFPYFDFQKGSIERMKGKVRLTPIFLLKQAN